jgi:hypothetical protein
MDWGHAISVTLGRPQSTRDEHKRSNRRRQKLARRRRADQRQTRMTAKGRPAANKHNGDYNRPAANTHNGERKRATGGNAHDGDIKTPQKCTAARVRHARDKAHNAPQIHAEGRKRRESTKGAPA